MLVNSYFALFVIIAIGMIIGRGEIKGVSLGSSAVIFVAMLFGHFGVQVNPEVQKIGLMLFIFTIGIQAGPSFFQSFVTNGKVLLFIALATILSASFCTAVAYYMFDIDKAIVIGMLTGALTSTPGLAAGIESTGSSLASIGYGIAYPFGVIGVILFAKLAPKFFKFDIAKAEARYEQDNKANFPDISNRNFEVSNPNIFGKTMQELKIRNLTNATVSRVKKGDQVHIANPKMTLDKGDIIKAVGAQEDLAKVELLVGHTSDQEVNLQGQASVDWVLLSNKKIANKTIGQLNLQSNYNATVTRVHRSGLELTPSSSTILRYGDRLLIASEGSRENILKLLGNNNKKLSETDFLPIALGIIIGALVGILPIPLPGGFNFKLGLTGGILFTSLLLSWKGKTGPVVWSLSSPANQLLRQFGLLLFLTPVGTNAGATLVETVSEYGFGLFGIAAIFTIVPMVIAVILGNYILNINPISLLGAIMGSMTSTPGLSALDTLTETDAPQIAYATVYPAAMVLLIVCVQLLSML